MEEGRASISLKLQSSSSRHVNLHVTGFQDFNYTLFIMHFSAHSIVPAFKNVPNVTKLIRKECGILKDNKTSTDQSCRFTLPVDGAQKETVSGGNVDWK